MRKIQLIIAREFMERVRKKSFVIATLLTPILTVGLMIAPTLIMFYGTSDQKQIVVVDRSGIIVDELTPTSEVMFVDQSHLSKREACSIYDEESGVLGVLYIGENVEQRDSVQLITNASSSVMIEDVICQQLNAIVEREKLRACHKHNQSNSHENSVSQSRIGDFDNSEFPQNIITRTQEKIQHKSKGNNHRNRL